MTKMHSSASVKIKPSKKRPIISFTCPTCQSTFTTRNKMKKHVDTEHEEGERKDNNIESPTRKSSKTDNIEVIENNLNFYKPKGQDMEQSFSLNVLPNDPAKKF